MRRTGPDHRLGERGLYRFGGLAGGSYTVTVELPGFTATSMGVTCRGPGRDPQHRPEPVGHAGESHGDGGFARDSLEAADVRRSAAGTWGRPSPPFPASGCCAREGSPTTWWSAASRAGT